MSAATTRTVIAMDPSKTTPRAATFAGAYAVTLDHSITGAPSSPPLTSDAGPIYAKSGL